MLYRWEAGIAMIFEDRDRENRIPHNENHHPNIDAFRKLRCNIVPMQKHDVFYGLLKSYVGNKWNITPFLKLIQAAISEIINGCYTEDDKRDLFIYLCNLEAEAIEIYYTSMKVLPSWGISMKHNIYIRLSFGDVQTIKVPLREYREMQYILSLEKKPLTSTQKQPDSEHLDSLPS